MDRITYNAANRVLADLAQNGGGTYYYGSWLPFEPKAGYAVGIGGIHLPASDVSVDAALWAMKAAASEHEASFVGTWLDDGVVYFDAVAYFAPDRREAAIRAGLAYGQKAIYDFHAGESVDLKEYAS